MDEEIKPNPTSQDNSQTEQPVKPEHLPTERIIVIERTMQVKNDNNDIVIKQSTQKPDTE